VPAVMCALLAAWVSFAGAGADRDKLLSEPGVYGTFAAFSFEEDWAKTDLGKKEQKEFERDQKLATELVGSGWGRGDDALVALPQPTPASPASAATPPSVSTSRRR